MFSILFALAISLTLSALPCASAAAAESDGSTADNTVNRVLVIVSYSYAWESVPDEVQAIRSTLGDVADVNYVFMNTKNIDLPTARANTMAEIQGLEADGRVYDAVMVLDDDALDFALDYRSQLFPDVPLVFTGINDPDKAARVAAQNANVTGINETFSFSDTIDVALKINPKATRIIDVTDTSVSGKGTAAQFMAQQEKYPNLEFSTLDCSQLTRQGIIDTVSSYSSDTILLYNLFTRDADGNTYTYRQAVDLIARNAAVPVYKTDDMCIGNTEALGGCVIDFKETLNVASNEVAQILTGTPAASFPVISPPTVNLFDQNDLDRFGISTASLPPDSTILNKKTTIFDEYGSEIVFALILFALLLIGLGLTSVNLRRRRVLNKQLVEANDQLANNQRLVSAAVEHSGLYFWELDIPTKTIISNQRTMDAFGIPATLPDVPQSLLRRHIIEPESAQTFTDLHEAVFRGEESPSDRILIRDTHDHVFWANIAYHVYRDTHGRASGAIGTLLDVSEQVAIERRYASETARLRTLEKEAQATFLYDLTANHFLESTGDDLIQGEGRSTTFEEAAAHRRKLVYPDDLAVYDSFFDRQKLLAGFGHGRDSFTSEFRFRANGKDFTWNEGHAELFKHPETGNAVIFLVFRDITDQKNAQTALDTVINETTDSIGLYDRERNEFTVLKDFAAVSPVAPRTPCAQVLEAFIRDRVAPASRAHFLEKLDSTAIDAALAKGSSYSVDYTFVRSNGDVRNKQARLSLLHAEPHDLVIFVASDVTDIVRTEQENTAKIEHALDEARRANASKDEFLSRMSHDMRTPMNAIIGISGLAREEVRDPEATLRYLAEINQSAVYLLGLINDILSMSRLESQKITFEENVIDTKAFAEDLTTILKPLIEEKHIRFESDASGIVVPYIIGDRLRMQQVFLNLLSNAIKYSDDGGRVMSWSKGTLTDDGRVEMETVVKDEGCGMSAEFLPHAFEPFTREKDDASGEYQSSGLGLAIVKSLVTQMGGTIDVTSEPGQGTKFTVHMTHRIATAEDLKAQETLASPTDLSLIEGAHILLAEDNAINAEISIKNFERRGMTVTLARNGKEALDTFAASTPGTFDAIFLDIRMPVMDGLEAARAIRALDRDDARTVPMLALSANAYPEDVEKSLAAGMNAHLSKPPNLEVMYRTLAQLLAERRRNS